MKEAFLAYVWKYQLFNTDNLQSLQKEAIKIISVGTENQHDGPDFFNAKIKIGTTTWAGNVEIHIQASDWYKHKHETDEAYQNIILHVVYEYDVPKTDALFQLPTLVLQQRLLPNVYQNYLRLLGKHHWIPCEKLIHKTREWTLYNWLDRLVIERLQQKIQPILTTLKNNKYSWETACYEYIAKGFGAKVNALPFQNLAKSLPIHILSKHKNQLFQLEALIFGQAGLLKASYQDDYPKRLYKEYTFLKSKFQLQPLVTHTWKFAKLRPSNFPTIRLAQFALLIHQSKNLFSKIIERPTLETYHELFEVSLSGYWKTHYVFDKLSTKERPKRMGKQAITTLIINTIVPLLFVYGKERGQTNLQQTAIELLQKLKSEKNSTIKKWQTIGIKAKTAADSQALLQLKNEYCLPKKCLTCSIGYGLINSSI